MCVCVNMLTNHIEGYSCKCKNPKNCDIILDVKCEYCGWTTQRRCNVCQTCKPHDQELHDFTKNSACYDCTTYQAHLEAIETAGRW